LCCRVAAPTARAVRCGRTGQKPSEVVVPAGIRYGAGKGRTSGEAEESVVLVLASVIAAIPRTRASCREETVSSVEHCS
jgi:hypothetical protein